MTAESSSYRRLHWPGFHRTWPDSQLYQRHAMLDCSASETRGYSNTLDYPAKDIYFQLFNGQDFTINLEALFYVDESYILQVFLSCCRHIYDTVLQNLKGKALFFCLILKGNAQYFTNSDNSEVTIKYPLNHISSVSIKLWYCLWQLVLVLAMSANNA